MNEPLTLPHVYVNEMQANQSVAGFYILESPAVRTTGAGKTFLSANISDRSGSVNVIFWDYNGPFRGGDGGKTVFIRGRISEFKGNLQITLEALRPTTGQDIIDLSALVPVAPIDCDRLYGEILKLVNSLTDEDYRSVAREFLSRHEKAFLSIPAAKSVHHSFLHGLLMHTGTMLKAADRLAALYPQVIDRNLLLTGTLLHDFAKREEFTFSELGLVSGYSVKGELLGHLVMGAQEVGEIAGELEIPEEKSVLLQHMLLSHHGKPEYGAAVIPMCAEADLLSMLDMMDSRMEIYRENLQDTPMGQFSGRIFALDGNRVYRHYAPEK